MKVISTEKHPIKMWIGDIEEGALQQADLVEIVHELTPRAVIKA